MPRPLEELRTISPQRVCLIKPSALGDVVHTLPALSALRELWPKATISWVVNGSLRGLLDGHPDLDEVIPYERRGAGFVGLARFLSGLRGRRFDLTIDLQGLLRSGIMTAATGAPIRLGAKDAREGASLAYSHVYDAARSNVHAVDRYLHAASLFGADVSRPRFVVATDEADREWARETLAHVPRPRLILNTGAQWLTKRWPPGHFAEVARRAVSERGAGLIAVGAPGDRPLVDALREGLAPIPLLDLCGRTTLRQLAALAAESDLFVSNDTGPLHLAVAAGARVVGIYTCTSPRLTGPYGPRAVTVQSCVWCAPSYVRTCQRLDCMNELGPDRVWPAVLAQLDSGRALAPTAA
ncbi:MAG: glycosyltransferase family 9 protein [Isosphaeraceae bacterium]|nr:glycosyltransferase family 9 protein [Isosphaeraceae bacterium]